MTNTFVFDDDDTVPGEPQPDGGNQPDTGSDNKSKWLVPAGIVLAALALIAVLVVGTLAIRKGLADRDAQAASAANTAAQMSANTDTVQNTPEPTAIVVDLSKVPAVAAPEMPAEDTAPAQSEDPTAKMVCDQDLLGTVLNDPTATEIMVKMPEGYKYLLASMDAAVVRVPSVGESSKSKAISFTDGTVGMQVQGTILFADSSFSVLTDNFDKRGLGWNGNKADPNTGNQRWNIHACAIATNVDPIGEFRQWQFGKNDGTGGGDAKPNGVIIREGVADFVWVTRNFTLADFDAIFPKP